MKMEGWKRVGEIPATQNSKDFLLTLVLLVLYFIYAAWLRFVIGMDITDILRSRFIPDMIFFAVGHMILTVIHEYSHWGAARIFGHSAKVSIRIFRGFPRCNIRGPMAFWPFVWTAAMPAIVLIILLLIILFLALHWIFPSWMVVFMLGTLKMYGCSGDIQFILEAFRYGKDCLFEQFGEEAGHFLVYRRQA
jgi:hypothetical protein